MSITSGRGHGALRIGRWSDAGANYFLTCCTDERKPGLQAPELSAAILAVAQGISAEGAWSLRTCVTLPDHVHLLVALGAAVQLSDVVRLFKGRSASLLRAAALRWQRGFFDHRMRDSEDLLPVFRYIYLNPYRAGLLSLHEQWPSYFCDANDWAWFGPLVDIECPEPEWLA